MRVLLTLAMGAAFGASAIGQAYSQGPVREGLRRTGEAAVEGTRRVVQGAGEVTAGAIRGTGQIIGGVADATAQGVRGGLRAITPGVPLQARADANLQNVDKGREARWRFQQHNGEWWYYTPQNAWMYHRDGQWNTFAENSFTPNPALTEQQLAAQQSQPLSGEHTAGYRGVEGEVQPVVEGAQQVRIDRYGRQYICDNGRAVYLTNESGQEWSSGYRGEQMAPDQPTPTPAEPSPPAEAAQDSANSPETQPGQEPSASAPASESAAPATPADPAPPAADPASPAAEAPADAGGINVPDTAAEGAAAASDAIDSALPQ